MATSAEATQAADQITFAHNSERQFARLLDFYRVEWEYEPTAFPIEWDAAGRPVQLFRPDFYLPGFRLYIEITTLNQRLVTKKNRKVRRLRELYPDVRIKVLYQRDYLSLLAKYGLEPPSQMVDPEPPGGRPPSPAGPAAEEGGAARVARPEQAGSSSTGAGGSRTMPAGASRSTPAGAPSHRSPGGTGGLVEQGRAADRATGGTGGPGGRPGRPRSEVAGAVGRARAAGRPRVIPDPPTPAPPLPADPELVRLAQVPLPAELADRRGRSAAERAG